MMAIHFNAKNAITPNEAIHSIDATIVNSHSFIGSESIR